jgi:5'-3' exonuclease
MENIIVERDDLPYTPLEQLKMVLPVESHNLIRDRVNSSKYITDVKECHILKRYSWEGNPVLPHL